MTLKVFDDQVPSGRDDVAARIAAGNVNRPPAFEPRGDETRDVDPGVLLTISLEATNPDGDNVSFPPVSLPLGASLVDNTGGNSEFQWIPGLDQNGIFMVEFIAVTVAA